MWRFCSNWTGKRTFLESEKGIWYSNIHQMVNTIKIQKSNKELHQYCSRKRKINAGRRLEIGYSSQETNSQLSFSLIREFRDRYNEKIDRFCEGKY